MDGSTGRVRRPAAKVVELMPQVKEQLVEVPKDYVSKQNPAARVGDFFCKFCVILSLILSST